MYSSLPHLVTCTYRMRWRRIWPHIVGGRSQVTIMIKCEGASYRASSTSSTIRELMRSLNRNKNDSTYLQQTLPARSKQGSHQERLTDITCFQVAFFLRQLQQRVRTCETPNSTRPLHTSAAGCESAI
jgi:hypothetical protein